MAYYGMNRQEMFALTALLVVCVIGAGAKSYLNYQNGAGIYVVPSPQSSLPGALLPSGANSVNSAPPASSARRPDGRLDLNRASLSELKTLPRIAEERAKDILQYRERHGGFRTAEQLTEITGIGEKTWISLEPLVWVATPPPTSGTQTSASPTPFPAQPDSLLKNQQAPVQEININTATAPELEQLWNIGPSKSAAILQWRRLHGPFHTPSDLAKVPGIGPETLRRNQAKIRVR